LATANFLLRVLNNLEEVLLPLLSIKEPAPPLLEIFGQCHHPPERWQETSANEEMPLP
jgi:hypothetical protein